MDGDIRVTFATDRTQYLPADVIQLYLVVENLGETSVTYTSFAVPQDYFFILRPPYQTWEECCADWDWAEEVLWYLPQFIYFIPGVITLAPGDCRAFDRAIDLEWTTDPAPGIYAVLGGLFELRYVGGPTVYDGEFVAPPGGARLDISILGPVVVQPSTWGRIKSLYR
jgi:hypothetical protein